MPILNCKQLDEFTKELKGLYSKLNVEHMKIRNNEVINFDLIEWLKEEIDKKINYFKEKLDIPYVKIGNEIYEGSYYTTTGKTGQQLLKEFDDIHKQTGRFIRFMLQSPEFIIAKEGERIPTVRLPIFALFPDKEPHTHTEVLARAFELGLDFLPHETAANLIKDEKSPSKNYFGISVVSKPITDQEGNPRIFRWVYLNGEVDLTSDAMTVNEWSPNRQLMFAIRKKKLR